MDGLSSQRSPGASAERFVEQPGASPQRAILPALARLWGCDYRSLALFRMALGSLLLLDLANRAIDLRAHYTDQGVLPRDFWVDYFQTRPGQIEPLWSLHLLSGQAWAQGAMFLVAGWFALWLLIGYRTRLATMLSAVLHLSLALRNPYVNSGGDLLLSCLLFWSLFLPLGAAWSIDQRLAPTVGRTGPRLLSVGTLAVGLQVCLMYWLSAYWKTDPVWTRDATALHYVMHLDMYVTPLGSYLLHFPTLLAILTLATYWLEIVGPILAFSPWKTAWFRTLVVLVFWCFHLGMVLTMRLGLFPWICMAAWIVFLPTELWDMLGRAANRLRYPPSLLAARHAFSSKAALVAGVWTQRRARGLFVPFATPERPRVRPTLIGSLIAGVFLGYVLLWNVRELNYEKFEPTLLPAKTDFLARMFGIRQRWNMFAPVPMSQDGWYVMRGELADGSEVNLWEPGQPLPWAKPEVVSDSFRNQRWRKYLLHLSKPDAAVFRRFFVDWLQSTWDAAHVDEPGQQVRQIQLIFMSEPTPAPRDRVPEPERVELWTWQYPAPR